MEASLAPAAKAQLLWLLKFALLVPAVAIVFAAVPRLVSGLALETAFPAPAYMQMNVRLTKDYYAAVAQILSHAPSEDGDTQLWHAEALLRDGHPAQAAHIAAAALKHVPASARGWAVLADALRQRDPQRAASALALSLELGPREYYLALPQAEAGAPLWRYLPAAARAKLLDVTRLLITNESLRPGLRALLATEGGPALVTRALAGRPDELRTLNRSLARDRLGLP